MSKAPLNETDAKFLRLAYDEAKAGYDEGGCPIGSVIARGSELVASGRNQRCLLYTSPSPRDRG